MILLVDAFFAEPENQVLLKYYHDKSKIRNHELKIAFTVEQSTELIERMDFHLVIVNLVLSDEDIGSSADQSRGAEVILMCLEKAIPVMAILEAIDTQTGDDVILLNCVPGIVGQVDLNQIEYHDIEVFHDRMSAEVWLDIALCCLNYYGKSNLDLNQHVRLSNREEESLRKGGLYD